MNSLLTWFKPDSSRLKGGVHPDEHKLESASSPLQVLALPKEFVLPLRQHVGNIPKLRVSVGESVLKGQLLAEAEGNISAAVHAPTSGKIVAIEERGIPHPSGLPDVSIVLEADGEDRWIEHHGLDWRTCDKSVLIAKLRESGIVGMGGAAFPTQIKLQSGGRSQVHTLIINGAECEPYITCDDRLMRERAQEIVHGIEIAMHMLSVERCIVGVEDNKPEAATAMRDAIAAAGLPIELRVVPTLYPSGDARQLMRLLTGIEVAGGKRSTEMGLQCFNVATMLALYRYFSLGEPAIARIVTITGNVPNPANYEVRFGTPVSALVAAAGGAGPDTNDYIMGGPMMGFSLPNPHVPITKATNCIIVGAPNLFPPAPEAMPCIRCARCADACPVDLQPQELYWFAKSDNFEKSREYHLFDCIECGCCSYVCPSQIPLVQYYRYAKSEIIAQDKAKQAADIARERNENRLKRIEREKQERAQKHAQKAAGAGQDASKAVTSASDEAKKAAIAAAMERAKAQKAEVAPANTSANTAVAAEIAAIDAARAAAGIAAESTSTASVTANASESGITQDRTPS